MNATTLGKTHCPDCGVPQVNGVFHHLRKCPKFHRKVADHYEQVAKEAKRAKRKETVAYYSNPMTFWDWLRDDWERMLCFWVVVIAVLIGVSLFIFNWTI